ncbi:LOW QUALITY PROTEIN: hypothetical protein HID58_077801, partial [Brassica napus]
REKTLCLLTNSHHREQCLRPTEWAFTATVGPALHVFFFYSGMKNLRQFSSSLAFDSGGGGFHSLASPALGFSTFISGWGYLLRSGWLSRDRSRIDRLMLSEIEAKAKKTNEMEELEFFNLVIGGLVALEEISMLIDWKLSEERSTTVDGVCELDGFR